MITLLQGIGFFGVLKVIQAGGFLVGGLASGAVRLLPRTRTQALMFGIFWTLAATLEFWIAGPWSFIATSNEFDYGPPLYQYLNQWHDGGEYTHAYAGGNDIRGMAGTGGQYVSLERLLLNIFPLWIAHAVHKIMVVGIGFIGVYKIGRYFKGGSRWFSVALAAYYTLSFEFIVNTTWYAGLGYALIPLAAYLIVFRAGRKNYLWGVAAVSALNAISCEPAHSVMTLLFAVGLAALLVNTLRLQRILIGLGIVLGAVLLNWHEALYGMIELAPYSHRQLTGTLPFSGIQQEFSRLLNLGGQLSAIPVIGISLFITATVDRRAFPRALAVVALAAVAGPLLVLAPWKSIGLDLFSAVNFRYLAGSVPLIAVMMAARAASLSYLRDNSNIWTGRQGRRWAASGVLTVTLFALAAGQLAWYKAYNFSVWLSEGGVSLAPEPGPRISLDWVPDQPTRVISVPYRMPANFAAALGLHAFDGFINLTLLSQKTFWELGVTNPNNTTSFEEMGATGANTLRSSAMDFKCCRRYDISSYLDLNLLRAANVGYILSILPLYGGGLRQVSGPSGALTIPRSDTPLMERIRGYFRMNFDPTPIRVYALPDPLPRVFAARDIVFSPSGSTPRRFLDQIAEQSSRRGAVVDQALAGDVGRPESSLRILGFELVRNGFDVELEAPDGGIVVFNAAYLPFWKASVDGTAVKAFPVNMIHTAVTVPAGARRLRLRYARTLLRERIFPFLKGAS